MRSAVSSRLRQPEASRADGTVNLIWRLQGFGQLRFGREEGRHGNGYKQKCAHNFGSFYCLGPEESSKDLTRQTLSTASRKSNEVSAVSVCRQ